MSEIVAALHRLRDAFENEDVDAEIAIGVTRAEFVDMVRDVDCHEFFSTHGDTVGVEVRGVLLGSLLIGKSPIRFYLEGTHPKSTPPGPSYEEIRALAQNVIDGKPWSYVSAARIFARHILGKG